MVERRFRHLPVLDADGAVVGVLDIAKCLYDAISRLERHLSTASSALSQAVLASMPRGRSSSCESEHRIEFAMQLEIFIGLIATSECDAFMQCMKFISL